MQETDAKAAVRRLFDTINQGKLDRLDDCFTPDFINHDPFPDEPAVRGGIQQSIARMRKALPDFHIDVKQIISEDDRVAVQLRATGTQQGEYLGKPPTNQQLVWEGLVLFRVQDGKVAERWAKLTTNEAAKPAGTPSITMMPPTEVKQPTS